MLGLVLQIPRYESKRLFMYLLRSSVPSRNMFSHWVISNLVWIRKCFPSSAVNSHRVIGYYCWINVSCFFITLKSLFKAFFHNIISGHVSRHKHVMWNAWWVRGCDETVLTLYDNIKGRETNSSVDMLAVCFLCQGYHCLRSSCFVYRVYQHVTN